MGKWALKARTSLRNGGKVDLKSAPSSVKVLTVTNVTQKRMGYQLSGSDSKAIYAFAKHPTSLLILTRYNQTANALRAFFGRSILLWEGHTRSALDGFVQQVEAAIGPEDLGAAIVKFMDAVAVGFSPSQFGNRFQEEIADRCSKRRTGKPAMLQTLASCIVDSPDHKGAAAMLKRLYEYVQSEQQFLDVKFDCPREFWDAIRLGQFDTPADGLADLAHRRAYARAQPPARAISTIHKAKGLECESVVLMPCDAKSFPDKYDARCLLYVALSRAKNELMLVLSENDPSPLLLI